MLCDCDEIGLVSALIPDAIMEAMLSASVGPIPEIGMNEIRFNSSVNEFSNLHTPPVTHSTKPGPL